MYINGLKESLAKEFAAKAHAGQTYGDGQPYTVHLEAVVQVAKSQCIADQFSLAGEIIIAAWLHDVVEDTAVTIEEVRAKFGYVVAQLVHAVTNEPGKNRIEKAERTLPKILVSGPQAVALKLCDRIANVEACINGQGNPKLFRMYFNEYTRFQELLDRQSDVANAALWDRLDRAVLDGMLKKLSEG